MRTLAVAGLAAGSAAAAGAGLLGYLRVVRPWHLRWGATEDEVRAPMAGDSEVAQPLLAATRAVTIEASPQEVWPWLVQMGYGRAGFYSYDILDNRAVPSAERIIPEFQGLKVGGVMPTGPRDGFVVEALERERLLLLAIRNERIQATFSTLLKPMDGDATRMLMRARVRFKLTPVMALYAALFDLGDFVMMRKMMLGIKRRAEALAAERRAFRETLENAIAAAMMRA